MNYRQDDDGTGLQDVFQMLTGTAISGAADSFRHRLYDLSFQNTTELNSTIHFCRVNHNDFNYSTNPTYVSSSKIVVKNNTQDCASFLYYNSGSLFFG